MKKLLFFLLLLPVSAFSQTHTTVTIEDAQTINSNKIFNGTIAVNNPGVFTSSQMNEYSQSLVNNCNPSTLWHSVFTLFATEGITGCVTVPTGPGVVQATGVSGYAENSSTTINAVGLQGFSRNDVTNAKIWGMDTMTTDQTGIPTNQMYGYEDDVNVRNTTSIPIGELITGFWTAQPTNGYMMQMAAPQNLGFWPMGIDFLSAATTTVSAVGAAIFFNPIATGANQPSQGIFFLSNAPVSGQNGAGLQLLANGNLAVTTPGLPSGLLTINGNSATQTIGTGSVTTAGTAVTNGTCQAQTGITVTGALTTDSAVANINAARPATWQTGIVYSAEITGANTVTVSLCNPTAGSITPAATQVNVRVVR